MKIKQLLKSDKKASVGIYILLLLGVLLLAFGSVPKRPAVPVAAPEAVASEKGDYVERLEERLEEALSSIEGVGRVSVMLVAENSGSLDVGKDGSGDNSKTVVLNKQGGGEALVLAENAPDRKSVV